MPRSHAADESDEQVGYPIKSVDRALTLLREFLHRRSLTVSEAAGVLGVSKSTAHRLLAMLLHHGFVRQDARSKAYLGGPTLLEVGLAFVTQLDVRSAAQPSLQALVDATGETAHLMILEDTRMLFLDGRESSQALRAGLRVGSHVPVHLGASGKAVLATMRPEEVERYWARLCAAAGPPDGSSLEKLKRELQETRDRGWGLNDEATDAGVRSVSVAIAGSGPRAEVRAALTVAGPVARMPHERLPIVAAALARETARIAERLSGTASAT